MSDRTRGGRPWLAPRSGGYTPDGAGIENPQPPRVRASGTRIAVGPDGDNEPTLWLCVGDADPVAILSRYQLSHATRHLWPILAYRAVGQVGGVSASAAASQHGT